MDVISQPEQPGSVGSIVVMGVSGCGKTTVGRALAAELDWPFVDADDLHPARNLTKMRQAVALTDEDRAPWLALVGAQLARTPCVVACSALRRMYRDSLRERAPLTRFLYLEASASALEERLAQRRGHFMPASLLASQLDTLEPLGSDEAGKTVDASNPIGVILAAWYGTPPQAPYPADAGSEVAG